MRCRAVNASCRMTACSVARGEIGQPVGRGRDKPGLEGLVETAEDQQANADSIIGSLRDAVKDKHTKGIILHANSPGGSPVQSSYI